MIRNAALAAALTLPLLAANAQAGIWNGHANDTGGIIPWSPAIAGVYHDIAAAQCARWNKLAIITSVHRIYGDYVAYVCVYPRYYDPRKGYLGVLSVRY